MKHQAVGYEALIERYRLDVIPNWHRSYLSNSQTYHHVYEESDGTVREIYSARYDPGKNVGEQLAFAFKYDGINLAILSQLFTVIDTEELLAYIRSKPTGKYARRIWFLYEFLTGKRLPLEDLKQGNYIDLLEPEEYFTVSKGDSVKRQRIRNNLPGNEKFCPIVRKTQTLQEMESRNPKESCETLIAHYSPSLLKRALSYLYTKETKSSFAIEHESIDASRSERFVALLQEAEREDFCSKERLVELQNRIVDPRFADTDYRKEQNYVGETVAFGREKIHYVSPKPEDLESLMEGLIDTHRRMQTGDVHPIVHAAVIAYGFVYLHPFEDGNGRIHRFLIHNILAIRGFTPPGIMFPVSAAMLNDPEAYDISLEAFSQKILPKIEYTLDEEGRMTVHNHTAIWYRYPDMTPQTEALYRFVMETIEKELPKEVRFIAAYDEAKKRLKEIVDMPDRLIDLFIRFVLQNHGRLSKSKREKFFKDLSEEEVEAMEREVVDAFGEVGSDEGEG